MSMELYGSRHDSYADMAHYGVKGMKWGVRRAARRDAKETARAKMFYGEGAGTRRKLIKATVAERSKDPMYKEEYEKYLSKQDMARHASAAKRERKTKTAYKSTTKTGRGIINILNGNSMAANATAVTVMSAYAVAHQTGADKVVAAHARDSYRAAKVAVKAWQIKREFS